MEKYKNVLAWAVVVGLGALFAWGWIDLTSVNDQWAGYYVWFTQDKPAVMRVLVPLLARGLMLTGIPAGPAMALVVFSCAVAAYWAIKLFFSEYGLERWAVVCWGMIFVLLLNKRNPFDWMTVFIFSLAYYLLRRYDPRYFLLFTIAALHRETVVLLVLLYMIYLWESANTKGYWLAVLFQVSTILFIRSMIEVILDPGGHQLYVLYYDVPGAYLRSPAAWISALLLAGLFYLVWKYWYIIPKFTQAAFMLVPIQIALHLLNGYPGEVRVMAESFPIMFIVAYTVLYAERIEIKLIRGTTKTNRNAVG